MKNIIISVDPGKYATKAFKMEGKEIDKLIFKTKIFRLDNNMDFDIKGNSYKVKYENQNFVIGDQGEEINYSIDKSNLNHKLAIYTAVTQLLGNYKVARLVVGCPTSIYKNKQLRDSYKDYIKNNGIVNISVNDIDYSFLIENVFLLPEGSGIVYLKPELFKDKRVAVIDLGGLNMNFTVYDSLIPQISSMFTVNHGANELETRIMNELNTRYGVVLNLNDMQQIMKQGGLKCRGIIEPESKTIIDNITDQFVIKILQEIKKNNFNLDFMDVVFVGGTSLLVKSKILHYVPHALIIDDAQWANVLGFYKIGAMKYEIK